MSGSAAARPVLYLLHGLLGTAPGHFAPQIRAWRDRFQLVPVDLPGHGRCPLDARRPYYATAQEYLAALVGRFGPGHLMGASYLGGTIALRAALYSPDSVRSVVLTGYVPSVPDEAIAAWAAGFTPLADGNPELAAQYERLHGTRWRATVDTVAAELAECYADSVAVPPALLAQLRVPTLLANGSLKSSERAAVAEAPDLSPYLSAELIEGAGHIAGHERPAEFNAAAERFWRDTVGEAA